MIEYIGPIISFYKALTEGIKSIRLKGKSKEKINVQRKIILIQITLEMIIDTADQILSIVASEFRKTHIFEKKLREELRRLTYNQSKNLDQLIFILNDETSEKLLKLFVPQLRRDIIEYTHIKIGRITQIRRNLRETDSEKIKKLYNKKYYDESLQLISQLKDCSTELSGLIKTQIKLEDAILSL